MADICLRPYQGKSAEDIRGAFLQGIRSVLLVSPTSSGKTVTFSYIARGAAARGNPVLILAHRDFLIKQASAKLSEYGVGHGIIMGDYSETPHAMVQVGSVQTMIRRMRKRRYNFKLIVIDEAHLSAAKTYLDIIDNEDFKETRILGVTGSPCRLDGRGLGSTAGGRFDHMVESVTTRELIDDGYAVQPIVYAPLNRLDLSKVQKQGADYNKQQLSSVMNTRVITGNAIDHYREHAMHVPACTWCVDIDHARTTAAEFNAAGIKSVMLYGDSTGEERDRAMRQLADGSIYNITFCQLLVEGVDCPAIGCIIGLRPTYSLAGYLQTNGRMLRVMYAPGYNLDTREGRFAAIDAGPKGRKGIFLDCAGLTFRHGFIDEVREWSLLGVPKKSKADEAIIAIRQCPICMIVFPPAPVCPGCGYVFEIRSREIEREDGRLDELTPEMLAGVKNKKRIDVGRAETREELEAIATARNYSPAWVNVQLRIKAGQKKAADIKATQKQQWFEEQAKAARSNPKFNFDWPEV
jgi:superfamily II DNA or RNA helicase